MSIFTLYRFYNHADELLYVGLTINPGRRMAQHRDTKPWWATVAKVTMEQHDGIDALRAAERAAIQAEKPLHNIRMTQPNSRRVDPPETLPEPFDGLVGRHFHSWRPKHVDDPETATIRGGNVLDWQGYIAERVEDHLYIVQLYSWWDGQPSDQRIVQLDDMKLWTFYDSALEMQIGLGCQEAGSPSYRPCGNPVTHYIDHRHIDGGLYVLCGACVERYPGFSKAKEFKWRKGKPVLP